MEEFLKWSCGVATGFVLGSLIVRIFRIEFPGQTRWRELTARVEKLEAGGRIILCESCEKPLGPGKHTRCPKCDSKRRRIEDQNRRAEGSESNDPPQPT